MSIFPYDTILTVILQWLLQILSISLQGAADIVVRSPGALCQQPPPSRDGRLCYAFLRDCIFAASPLCLFPHVDKQAGETYNFTKLRRRKVLNENRVFFKQNFFRLPGIAGILFQQTKERFRIKHTRKRSRFIRSSYMPAARERYGFSV